MSALRWSDIAPIFNLAQAGAMEGCFSNLYLRPRYQAGLAIQLFSIRLFGKLRLPDRTWSPARIDVLRCDGAFAGFVLTRSHCSDERRQEIAMCALKPQLRGSGKGRRMLRHVLDRMPAGSEIDAHCLPNAKAMRRLLGKLGFRSVSPPRQSGTGLYAETLRAIIPETARRKE